MTEMNELSPQLERLQSLIDYRFNDIQSLLQALTHTSFGHEHFSKKPNSSRDNERLEFLGDAILDGIISDLLFDQFKNVNEGQLSKLRASSVNEKTLSELAKRIQLNECIRLGKGEVQTGGREKPSILSSTFEALIAAVYLDGGFEATYSVVKKLFLPLFKEEGSTTLSNEDYKTELQEKMQAENKITPTYCLKTTTGPDHAKIFHVEVQAGETILAEAHGPSKKEAEQNAAREALQQNWTQKLKTLKQHSKKEIILPSELKGETKK